MLIRPAPKCSKNAYSFLLKKGKSDLDIGYELDHRFAKYHPMAIPTAKLSAM